MGSPIVFVWHFGDLQPQLRSGAPKDTILYYFGGGGTSRNENPPSLPEIMTWAIFLPEMSDYFGKKWKTLTFGGFSAGGRAVQVQLRRLLATPGYQMPDAVLIADGLYADYVAPHTPDQRSLQSIIDYAILAASGAKAPDNAPPGTVYENGFTCVLWHSNIVPPGYASTKECCDLIRNTVATRLGVDPTPVAPTSTFLGGRAIKSYWGYRQFHVIEYAGADAAEHIAEAHLIDDVMRHYCPWFTDDNRTSLEDYAYFPEIVRRAPLSGIVTSSPFSQAVLQRAIVDLEAGVTSFDARVLQMMGRYGVTPPANWCACAVGTWIWETWHESGGEIILPIQTSAGAKATMVQFQKAARWITAAQLREHPQLLRAGMVPVWDRYDPKETGSQSWWGHIGIVEQVDTSSTMFNSIEGNSRGDDGSADPSGVKRRTNRSIFDPKLLGCGVI
jgi:hypothetical protein